MVRSDDDERVGEAGKGAAVSASSSQRKVTHTHLGLRPKKSDSLHTRIRTSHPQPKHVSNIVDITSPTASELRSKSASARTSRNASEVGTNGGTSTTHPSREGSRTNDSSVDGDRIADYALLSEDEKEEEDEGKLALMDAEIPTTDIGIYDDTVYDEYLGRGVGLMRRALVRSLEWETPLLAKHQAWVRTPRRDLFFVYTSLVGSHSFFLIFLPISFWLVSGPFSRGLVNVLAFGVYFSSAIKDALCVPRPFSPPVARLVIGTFHLEYGFPSTHATNCISVVLYCYLWLNTIRPLHDPNSLLQSWLCEAGLSMYAVCVCYGRIYSGMHSIMDCVAGCIIGASITLIQWYLLDTLENLMATAGAMVPLVVWTAGLAAVIVHPQPLDDCPCFEDAIAFLSVVIGVVSARPLAIRLNLLDEQDPHAPRSIKAWTMAKASSKNKMASNLSNLPLRALQATKIVAVLVVGISCILLTRMVVKVACRVILPPIFRFVQGTFGFILPRRHYTSSTEYAAMQKATLQSRHSTSDNHTSATARSHKRHTSLSTAHGGTVRPISMETEGLRNRMRSHSLQSEKGGAGENTVKFTLGDGRDIPVPFTHPNTDLPGDRFSERIAGAISQEERKRQRHESTSSYSPSVSPNGKLASVSGTSDDDRQASATIEIAHYDVDVLSKVLVYSAIGLMGAGGVPALLYSIGLLPI